MLSIKLERFPKVCVNLESSNVRLIQLKYVAIGAYEKASVLAPKDPSAFSNLSAAYLEFGQYEKCIDAAQRALELSGDGEQKMAMLKWLSPRLLKAYLCLYQVEDATKVLSNFSSEDASFSKYQATIAQARAARYTPVAKLEYGKKLFDELPRYLPAM